MTDLLQQDPLKPELTVHLQPHSAIILDRKSMYYVRLSGRGVQLAMLLAKNGSLAKTARIWEIYTKESTDAAELAAELESHPFTAAWKEGLLEQPLMITGSTQAYLPISCTIQLTNACNLSCPFCYVSSGKPYPDELSTSQWIEVMQKLAAHGVADLTLTGGEARLARGFKDILVAAGSLFRNVTIFSNGLGWKDEEIELVRLLGNVSLQISIDGLADTHDKLRRRRGAFRESMRNVARFAEQHVPVVIAMTVNQVNAEEVYGVIEEAVNAGATVFRAGRTLPVGRATDEMAALPHHAEALVRGQLRAAAEMWGNQMMIIDWDTDREQGLNDFCTPGYLAWYIRADGWVTPCQIEEKTLGHILAESMHEIGSLPRLNEARQTCKNCRCMGRVELSDVDLPFAHSLNVEAGT